LSFDDLINLEYLLPAKYSRAASYLVHRSNIREMRKLKDSQNRYLWTDPVAIGQPATFHGAPVRENNNLSESEIYFGDYFKGYWLGDRRKMTIKITQDSETAFTKDQTAIDNTGGTILRSIVKNWVNCWNILKFLGQSAAKHLSKWQVKVQRLGFETATCGI